METNVQLQLESLLETLDRINFQPSCVDFEWRWRAEAVYTVEKAHTGFLIYCGFERPDTHSGETGRGWGRAWFVSKHCRHGWEYDNGTTKISSNGKELFMTAWMAIEQICKHELMEAFSVDGARLFNPHKSMESLAWPERLKKQVDATATTIKNNHVTEHFG